jgi:ferric-dicitrate binding protein FerR (iron transport regulator)
MHDDMQKQTSDGMTPDDGKLARLLEVAGPRRRPAPEAEASVRAAVEAEWQRTIARRRRRRPAVIWAAAASVAVAAIALWTVRPTYLPSGTEVAAVTRVVGQVEKYAGNGRWTPLAEGTAVTSGTEIRCGADGRAAFELRDGVGLRLDVRTRVALNDAQHATLSRGAVYVDSGTADGESPGLLLETPLGDVRHLGTQYEARLSDGTLRVAVREGRVEVDGAAGQVIAAAGEAMTVTHDTVAKSELGPSALEWDWIAGVTPPFSIEGRSVGAFLEWAGRETGRRVVYASSDVETQAGSITLSGTVEGLTPRQAIEAVLSTTSLRPVMVGEEIRIEPAAR